MKAGDVERIAAPLAAAAVMALGGAVMASWHLHWNPGLQLVPGLVPMQFNTSLTFFATGAGILLARGEHRTAGLALAILMTLFAALIGLQYPLKADFGIDQLFLKPYLQARTAYPGRMAPNTALCFTFANAALAAWHLAKRRDVRLNAVIFAGFVLCTISLIALAGYLIRIEAAYSWWGLSDMALHTAIGLLLTGTGLVFLARPFGNQHDRNPARLWLPAYAAMGGIIVTLLLSQALLVYDKRMAENMIVTEAQRVAGLAELGLTRGGTLDGVMPGIIGGKAARYGYEVRDEAARVLYRTAPDKETPPWLITATEQIDLPGTHLSLVVSFDVANAFRNNGIVTLVILCGCVLSLLFANALRQGERIRRYKVQLETMLETMVDGFISIDTQGTVLTYNQSCERIFGYAPGEVVGRNVSMLMPRNHADNHDTYLHNYLDTGIGKIIGTGRELQGRRKNGTLFPMDLSVADVRTGSHRIFTGTIRDITERKAVEEGLQRSHAELEQFAYVASHDLKAPLRGIDNLAKWIAEDLANTVTPDIADKLALMRSRVKRLEALLEDILSYSRAGRIVETPQEIDLNELVATVAEPIFMDGRFTLDIQPGLPVLRSSRTPLEQVFSNLLVNAIKHHDRGAGNIRVEIGAGPEGFLECAVIDDGPGIPPEFHDRVFQMFQTLQPRDKTEGSGLGMAIIKKLVEWQGGRVWIVSAAPRARGTAIRFLWPISPRNDAQKIK